MSPPPRTDVLICGAGPTGLVLALSLARAGVRIRVVDAAERAGTTSRALVVHARTLEFYRQMGFAELFIQEGLPFAAVNLWVRGRQVAHVELRDLGKGLSRFPHMLVVPQDVHEQFLIDQLGRAEVQVERRTELVGFVQSADRVQARLRRPDGSEETCEADWLAGCDGARSATRQILGGEFGGSTYWHIFFVADVDATGPVMNDQLHVALDESDLLGVFPLRGGRTGRLIGTVRLRDGQDHHGLTWDHVSKGILQELSIQVERVNWFSTYQVHHRVADRFRQGRVFLLGDAAHIHSPVGGQGMNTGIGDAVNLAWKLADVIRQRASEALLDTYEPERIAFAKRLVGTTDRIFVLATSPGRLARFIRTRIVPLILPVLVRFRRLRRLMFRTVSQINIHYRASRLSEGSAGAVQGGDRLPWVELQGGVVEDNHALFDDRQWQVHVYGEAPHALVEECRTLRLALHVVAWSPAMHVAGLTRDACYLIRPDAYVALASQAPRPGALTDYMERLGALAARS